jgi:hypothetical protein
MSKEFQEPEEKDMDTQNAEVVMDDFNPLDEPVLEKEYTKHNVRVNPKDFQTDIPEPSFMPPPMTGGLTEEEKTAPKKPQEPFNPKMNDLSKKDKHDSAEKVAEMIMTGYKWANNFADESLLFNERKLMKLQQEGEIDLSIEIPFTPTTTLTGEEFVQEFNEQTKGTIVVTKEFEEEVKPVLTRVLEKRGIGMTDEQYLIYLFGKDIAIKGFMFSQQLSVKKDMLNMLKEATQAMRGNYVQPQQPTQSYNSNPSPSTPSPSTPSQSEPEVVYEETPMPKNPKRNPDLNVNDFVNEMTGSIPAEEYHEEEEEKPVVKVISNGTPKGKRGRPKKK